MTTDILLRYHKSRRTSGCPPHLGVRHLRAFVSATARIDGLQKYPLFFDNRYSLTVRLDGQLSLIGMLLKLVRNEAYLGEGIEVAALALGL